MCRQAGITRATTIEEGFEAAATFATQPLPNGPRVAVLTTAGGWGVVTADAISANAELELLALPDDLRAAIDEKLPPRWSRNNPIDLAGAETRDTIPEVMELVARHPDVDAIVYLGIGIQSNQAQMMRQGPFFPEHGLERIVSYHERQDARFAQAAADISAATGKPILTATELAVASPGNPGPATVRATGRLCYPSANRAVTALGHLVAYAPRPAGLGPTGVSRRGRALTRSLAILCAIGGAAALVTGLRDDRVAAATPRPPAPSVPTPLASARRFPILFIEPVALARLQGSLAAIGPPAATCVAVDGATGPLVRIDATAPLAPASTEKLLTAAAALDVLGADHRFRTVVSTTAAVQDGTLTGDLFLVGGGDPVLTSPESEAALAHASEPRDAPRDTAGGPGGCHRRGRRAPHRRGTRR